VSYIGPVTDSELEHMYDHCDVIVAPSRYESFGPAYIEAMAHGIPVVGCRVGQVPDVVDDQTTGLLVESGNVDNLASALLQLVNDADLCRDLDVAAWAKAAGEFSREHMV
jgi:glycosyltransferase involved in cell wall biosynthesis